MTAGQTVVVLRGGRSAERAVSLMSGAEVVKGLRAAGYTVVEMDADQPVPALVAALDGVPAAPEPAIIFNALHGRWGEDGCVQGLLELMGLPYTHSNVLASALAMDKPAAKTLFASAEIPVVPHVVASRRDVLAGDVIQRPYVVKPIAEGSSIGVSILQPGDNTQPFDGDTWPYGERVMVERYVPGREFTVGVLGSGDAARALPVTEVVAKPGAFYDFDAKYTEEKAADHVLPAPVPRELYAAIQDMAVRAHQALGCAGVSRADLRLDETKPGTDGLVMLEVNTQPGMTPMSLVPEQAALEGMDFAALCAWLVEDARCRAA